MMQCSPVRGGQPFEEKNVEIINNAEELMAVGGGKLYASRIQCTVGTGGVSCTGSLSDFVGALNELGSAIGIGLYDWLH
jgi:hypothetical protein